MIVAGPEVGKFVSEICGAAVVAPFTTLGLQRDGEVIAGAVFNCFTNTDIHVTVAAKPGAMTREFVRECGRYVFDQLGCERLTFITEKPPVALLARRLGGQVEGTLRNQFGQGRDAVLIGILKEDWAIR